ncbi:MAG: M6 family metalloprotease domain-containing protein [Halieaceae bacterium]
MKNFYSLAGAILAGMMTAAAVSAKAPESGAAEIVANLQELRFDKLGHPQIRSDSIKPVLASQSRPHNMLVLPVRFADKSYDRFAGHPDQEEKNRAYFQDLLFAGGAAAPRAGTLSHYYRHQSRGLYNISGNIHPVVELARPLSHYGRPVQNSDGSWRSDERATDLVKDALYTAYSQNPDFPWQDYDQWDPTDFDSDGNLDEPDGYLDHFVLVIAGKGQASCQGLYKLNEKLSINAKPDAFFSLNPAEQACADRVWPHRAAMKDNLEQGPSINGKTNPRGGIDIGNGMWVLDYNMQSEYTDVSTFIHEFGHSLGLPDVYARQTSNSSGSWEAMSATASPEPQELSAWSRTVLGWMKPCVIKPTEFDGEKSGSVYLQTMNDWSGDPESPDASSACSSAMVILPPKFRDIELGPLADNNGQQAVYSGQGNDMLRSLARSFDLSHVSAPVTMSLDTWFEIEAEWDYLYVEAAGSDGRYERIMPTDKSAIDDKSSIMPSGKGHEGKGSRPGFTGLSGDTSGDNKVQSAPGCDPDKKREEAEDKIGNTEKDPCSVAQWVHAEFDLSQFAGSSVRIRFSYFTDGAAVENGALIDNVSIPALNFSEDFEGATLDGWHNKGFTLSTGTHHLAVPHFYLLEYRDPYATLNKVKNYDANLSRAPGFAFFPDTDGQMQAMNVNYRPGVVMWYANGEYLWSQNEPAQFGPGKGFLLVVDSTPQEFEIPGVSQQYFRREAGWSWWEFDDEAQAELREAFIQVMCFQRRPQYYSTAVTDADRERCRASLHNNQPAVENLFWQDRQLTYGYTIINELLPGAERRARKGNTSLFDTRVRDGKTQYRLYDRILRNWHSGDAPFALAPFANGVEFYAPTDGAMRLESQRAFAPVDSFSDDRKYLNPHLPFGGADIPELGFSYQLKAPDRRAPDGSRVRIDYRWK